VLSVGVVVGGQARVCGSSEGVLTWVLRKGSDQIVPVVVVTGWSAHSKEAEESHWSCLLSCLRCTGCCSCMGGRRDVLLCQRCDGLALHAACLWGGAL
jgi:hypothetical protein